MTAAVRVTGRPRVNSKAWRIVAAPYFGILHDDQLWSVAEWARAERRRLWWRHYAATRYARKAIGSTDA